MECPTVMSLIRSHPFDPPFWRDNWTCMTGRVHPDLTSGRFGVMLLTLFGQFGVVLSAATDTREVEFGELRCWDASYACFVDARLSRVL